MKIPLQSHVEQIIKTENMTAARKLADALLKNTENITKNVIPLAAYNKANLSKDPNAEIKRITIPLTNDNSENIEKSTSAEDAQSSQTVKALNRDVDQAQKPATKLAYNDYFLLQLAPIVLKLGR